MAKKKNGGHPKAVSKKQSAQETDLDRWYIDRQKEYVTEAPTPEHKKFHSLILACAHLIATEIREIREILKTH